MPKLEPPDHRAAVQLLDAAATGMALLDADLKLAYLNPALQASLGLGTHSLLRQPLAALNPADPALAEFSRCARQSGGPLRGRDLRLCAVPERELRVDLNLTPLDRDYAAFLLEVHDLPVANEHEAPRVSETLRGLAHELKNPLAGVRGAAQLLARRLQEGAQKDLAEMIIAETDRLVALADRLLRPRPKPHLVAVNIHEVLERVRALVGAEAAGRMPIERDYDPSLPALRGDADRLTQLLLNLARNALQAGAGALRLRTRAEHHVTVGERTLPLALRVDIADDGPGVPPELQASVFLPLVSGHHEGHGLGLAVAQEIAREHGGTLEFKSRPGRTVFTLFLPPGHSHG